MTRDELTRKILNIKRAKSLSWKTIAAEIGGGSTVYLTAALMGQMKLRPEQAERAVKLLDLDAEEQRLLQEIPYRGSLPGAVPTDPLIYRFYELVQVYGTTWKELIQEEFGDGIMSAIDFDMANRAQA
ncbi:MAG TPA: cyanase [Stellaceae bacterium]|jgi:cyanate lyase